MELVWYDGRQSMTDIGLLEIAARLLPDTVRDPPQVWLFANTKEKRSTIFSGATQNGIRSPIPGTKL
jgi:hypothetical protein